jgi:hypothetical protein
VDDEGGGKSAPVAANGSNGRPPKHQTRPKIINPRAIAKAVESDRVTLPVLPTDEEMDRPKTRRDCEGGARPCPFVGCEHNLYLHVNERTGAIRLSFPDREPEDMPWATSCSLDVADLGDNTLEYVGGILNLTRERVRQDEVNILRKLRDADEANHNGILRELLGSASCRGVEEAEEVVEQEEADEEPEPEPVMTEQKMSNAVYEALCGAAEGMSANTMAEKLAISPESARQALIRLEKSGKATKIKRGLWTKNDGSAPQKRKRGKKSPARGDKLASHVASLQSDREVLIARAVQKAGMTGELKKIDNAIRALSSG